MAYTLEQLQAALSVANEEGRSKDVKHIQGLIDQATGQSEKFPMAPTPYGTGGGVSLSEMRDVVNPAETAPSVVRYGLPLAVGLATPAATVPTLLAAAETSAVISGLSELLAQEMEIEAGNRPERNVREVLSSTVSGLAVPLKLKDHSKIVNFLTNIGIFGAGSETSRAIEQGGFTPSDTALESVLRVGLPVVTSAVQARTEPFAERSARYAERRAAVQKERFGGAFLLSDLDESLTQKERNAIAGKSKKVRELMDNMSMGYGDAVREAFKDTPNPEELAKYFIPYQGKIDSLQKSVDDAVREYDRLAAEAVKARADNLANASVLEQQARDAASEVVNRKALYDKGLDQHLGSLGSSAAPFTPAQRKARIEFQINSVKNSIKNSVGKLYNDAGILENDIVANEQEIIDWISTGVTSTKDRATYIDALERVLERPGMKDDMGNITLKAYRDMRDELVDMQRQAGKDARSANRTAGQVYEAIKLATEDFLERNRPNSIDAFRKANTAARGIYAAREGATGAIGHIEDGDIGGLIKLIKKETYPKIAPEIEAYASAIRGLGDEASVAGAEQFVSDLHKAIRDEVVGQSIIEGSGQIENRFKAIDMNKLARNLSGLVSESGVPAELIGLGTKPQIDALARLAGREGRKGITAAELNDFFDDVSRVGYDKALARKDYEEAMKTFYIKTDKVSREEAMDRALAAQKKAGLDLAEATELADRASKDPLAQLMNNRSFQIDPDSTKNGQWIGRLLSVGESDLKEMMAALRNPTTLVDANEAIRRAKLADDISKATSAEMLFRPLRAATGETGQMVDLTGITNLFYGPGNKSFKAIVGDKTFNELKETWGKSAAGILKKRIDLGLSAFSSREDMIAAIAAYGLFSGKTTGGVVVGQGVGRIKAFLDRGHYAMLYLMFGDPKTSTAFRNAAYNVDKFASMSPRNAILVQLAERDDAERDQKLAESQYLMRSQPTR